MKSTKMILLFACLTITGISLKAQDIKTMEIRINRQQDQFQKSYTRQKNTIQTAYDRDTKTLQAKRNLAPGQKKLQQDLIRARYEQQKIADQDAFNANMNTIKEHRAALGNEKRAAENKGKEKHADVQVKQVRIPVKH